MKKTLSLQAGMGSAIVEHLRQFGDLPERGVVAGQAVASAIFDLYAGGGGVYNDVDIFRKVTSGEVLRREGMALQTVELTTTGLPSDAPLGENTLAEYSAMSRFLEAVRSYRVSTVSRAGMLNFVNCAVPAYMGRELSPSRIIQSFDLNCVRVAVDLETGTLVWDRHFEKFIHSRQLEIATVHTPWHTFLRLLKKLEELPGVYADVTASADVVTAIAQSEQFNYLLHLGGISDQFGEKNRALAERLRSQWEPYFNLQSHSVTLGEAEVALARMSPRGTVDSALLQRVNQLRGSVLHYGPQAVYAARRKTAATTVAKQRQVEEAAERAPTVARFSKVHGEYYVQGQVTDRHIDVVEAFCKDHMTMERVLSDMTLDEQFRAVKQMEALARERGGWVFGAIETQACANDLASPAALDLFLTRYHKERNAPIKVQPLDLPVLPKAWARQGWMVEELLTPLDLEDEGKTMGHCVGGYVGRVRSNSCRILRIRTGSDKSAWSTVELRSRTYGESIGPGVRLEVEQHRARFNKTPSADNERVLRHIVQLVGARWWERLAIRTGVAPHLGQLAQAVSTTLTSASQWVNGVSEALDTQAKRLEQRAKALQE
jgi:hypothetical protein